MAPKEKVIRMLLAEHLAKLALAINILTANNKVKVKHKPR